ncbi:MAG: DUF938 domain-containing protein [Pseudomonadota bacterium]
MGQGPGQGGRGGADRTGYPARSDGQPIALEARGETVDGRRYSPSVARNCEPIGDVLTGWISAHKHVLEIASGTGEHGVHLTQRFPNLTWTYSDIDADSRTSQLAWAASAGHGRLLGPLSLNMQERDWPTQAGGPYGAVYCANMIHIAPFTACEGLFSGAGQVLKAGASLLLYGPFARGGTLAPSNAAFDESLKSRDPSWGVRDLDDQLVPLATSRGFELDEVRTMPANNLLVRFLSV